MIFFAAKYLGKGTDTHPAIPKNALPSKTTRPGTAYDGESRWKAHRTLLAHDQVFISRQTRVRNDIDIDILLYFTRIKDYIELSTIWVCLTIGYPQI